MFAANSLLFVSSDVVHYIQQYMLAMANILYPPHCYYDSVKCPCIVRVTVSLKSVHC